MEKMIVKVVLYSFIVSFCAQILFKSRYQSVPKPGTDLFDIVYLPVDEYILSILRNCIVVSFVTMFVFILCYYLYKIIKAKKKSQS